MNLSTRRRRGCVLVTVVTALWWGLLSLTAPVPAYAHATLVASSPGPGALLVDVPKDVVLTFDQPVPLGLGRVQVLSPDGDRVDSGVLRRDPAGDRTVATDLPGHAHEGTYLVTWRVVSADSHPIQGSYTFTVGAPSAPPAAPEAASAGPVLGGLVWASRVLAYVGLVGLLGPLFFVVLVWSPGRTDPRVRRLARTSLVMCAAGSAATLLLLGPHNSGLSVARVTDPSVLAGTLDTGYGRAYVARLVLLALAVPFVRAVLRADAVRRPTAVALCVAATALLATWPLTGHAAAADLVLVAVVTGAAHLAAACAWLGGLVVLVAVALRSRPAGPLVTAMPRWSSVASWSVAVLVTTGLLESWWEVGEVGALASTTYGRVLVAKLVAVAALLGLGALGRAWVRRHCTPTRYGEPAVVAPEHALVGSMTPSNGGTAPLPVGGGDPNHPIASFATTSAADGPSDGAIRALRRSVAAEVGVGLIVLGLAAVLVQTVPARASYSAPFDAVGRAGEVTVQLVVEPARAGRNAVHLYTTDDNGTVRDVAEVTASARLPDRGLAPIDLQLRRPAPGHFENTAVDLPLAGDWVVTVKVRTSKFDQASFTTTVPVR